MISITGYSRPFPDLARKELGSVIMATLLAGESLPGPLYLQSKPIKLVFLTAYASCERCSIFQRDAAMPPLGLLQLDLGTSGVSGAKTHMADGVDGAIAVPSSGK